MIYPIAVAAAAAGIVFFFLLLFNSLVMRKGIY
jgi:hypothetical protein